MSDLAVLGFPRSTFVQIVRLVLTHKDVPYTFRDLEPDMGSPIHLALHPFDRVPILQHGDFTLYETSAIVAYLEEVFPMPSLQPENAQGRARMNQWISAVNSYYYPYMIYHVSHERNVFPQLGIPSDEKVVAHALPKIEVALQVMERQLAHRQGFLLGGEVGLADYYLLPSTYRLWPRSRSEGDVRGLPGGWGMAGPDGGVADRATLSRRQPPRAPIEHARKWAVSHRPKY
jgi:glutathione S-transferase